MRLRIDHKIEFFVQVDSLRFYRRFSLVKSFYKLFIDINGDRLKNLIIKMKNKPQRHKESNAFRVSSLILLNDFVVELSEFVLIEKKMYQFFAISLRHSVNESMRLTCVIPHFIVFIKMKKQKFRNSIKHTTNGRN